VIFSEEEEEGASIALVAIGDGSSPGSVSASSPKSSLRKTSERRAVRDCTRIVLGPWKWRNNYTYRISTAGDDSNRKREGKGKYTLSPQIVLRDHVLMPKSVRAMVLYTSDSFIFRINSTSGRNRRTMLKRGICRRSDVFLSLYGVGREWPFMEYARRALGWIVYSSPGLRVIW
jgi:hypothetical protein